MSHPTLSTSQAVCRPPFLFYLSLDVLVSVPLCASDSYVFFLKASRDAHVGISTFYMYVKMSDWPWHALATDSLFSHVGFGLPTLTQIVSRTETWRLNGRPRTFSHMP